ncbi:hypothetical protein [uncultured Jatrophihabitans sp.]|uniref:sialidase family protein n=1 Tax=uncultured Jatrophihabitans sp. TaxID=1610747 RepID=UPI0035CCA3EA
MRILLTALCGAVLALAGCTASSGGGRTGSASVAPLTGTVTRTTTRTATSSPPVSSTARTSGSTSGAPGRVAPKLTNFRIADVTFVGDQAWALGTADCLSGSGSDCSALEHSANGGRTWSSLPTPVTTVQSPFNAASCAGSCVEHVRFATAKVGYLYGNRASGRGPNFFTTADGGRTWRVAPGQSAEALESLNGDVIRVVTSTPGCPPACSYRVQTAPVGSLRWRAAPLPQPTEATAVALSRVGTRSYLETYLNPAGGAESARASLFVSTDGGRRWAFRGEPCPQDGRNEVDSTAMTTAPDGSLVVLCTPRDAQRNSFIAVSTNGARSFHVASRSALGAAPVSVLAAATSRLLVVSSDSTYRSSDGGRRFARLGSPGQLGYAGFATTSLGHAVSSDGRTLWTTTDGGADWTAHRFS